MNVADTLSGVLRVRPGQPRPHNLAGVRPDWAETLTRGRPPAEVPGLLAAAFNLCGHAHRVCAELALQAATGHVQPRVAGADRALQIETLREHLRRVALDWVQQLGRGGRASHGGPSEAWAHDSAASLRGCPLPLWGAAPGAHDLAATRAWLQQHWLVVPPETWLQRWERDGVRWLGEWCDSALGWLPALLSATRPSADVPTPACTLLHVHAGTDELRALAGRLRDEPGYTRRPHWRGGCAETGSWSRLHDRHAAIRSPWQRLGARLAELARLSLPDAPGRTGAHWLAQGSLEIAPGEGLAWVEMARGLLVHHVQIEGAGDDARMARYRVLAPTEWNFHPEGAVAQALENLTGEAADARVAALMAAYDPCVRFEVERSSSGSTSFGTSTQETVHA